MKNKALKNIGILTIITIALVLTACGNTTATKKGLLPLNGEATATGVNSEMALAINTVRTQGTTCDNILLNGVSNVSWNQKLAGAAKTQVKDLLKSH